MPEKKLLPQKTILNFLYHLGTLNNLEDSQVVIAQGLFLEFLDAQKITQEEFDQQLRPFLCMNLRGFQKAGLELFIQATAVEVQASDELREKLLAAAAKSKI